MAEKTISQLLTDGIEELTAAIAERDRLNIRIIKLQSQVGALQSLADRDALATAPVSLVGLSEAVRSVLRLANKPLSAARVKESLWMVGYKFGDLSNPSAAIHSTLKRMTETGELAYDPASKEYRIIGPKWMDGARRIFEQHQDVVLGKKRS